jgi:hypothetical protein
MRKLLNDHLDEIEKEIVEEIVSAEQTLQVQLDISFTPMKVCRLLAYF